MYIVRTLCVIKTILIFEMTQKKVYVRITDYSSVIFNWQKSS